MAVVRVEFTWDKKKALANLKKHGVGFAEAQTCFFDPLHIVIDDPEHSSSGDERMILLGVSIQNNTLVVVHVEIEDESMIRIISARKATKKERKQYEDLP